MTDLGTLQYFLGISVKTTTDGLILSQEQYAVDLLPRASMSNCNACITPVDIKSKPSITDGKPLENPTE
jgi:hypothetical protein